MFVTDVSLSTLLSAANYLMIAVGAVLSIQALVLARKRLSGCMLAQSTQALIITFVLLFVYKVVEEASNVGLFPVPSYFIDFLFSIFVLASMYTAYNFYHAVKFVNCKTTPARKK
jgi:hypothetical protein